MLMLIRYDTIRYDTIRYDTIRYDSVYSTCSKKLTRSQLSYHKHGTNRKIKEKKRTKNKSTSMISPVWSNDREYQYQ